jgi:MFS family permease
MFKETLKWGVDFFRKQRSPYKINLIKNIVQNFSMGLTQQYQSIYITMLGADPFQLGIVSSIGGLANALVTVPTGWLSDRYGIRRILIVSLLTNVLGFLVFGLTPSWQLTTLALLFTSLSWGSNMVVCPMVCGNTLSNDERATGMQICDTITAIPRIIAPIIAAYLITVFGGMNSKGIRPLYWIQVIGLLFATFIIYRYFEDPRKEQVIEPSPIIKGITNIFKKGVMVKRWIVYILLSTFPLFMSIYIPLYAREIKGANQFILGLMDTAYWLLIVILALPIGLYADRIGRKKAVLILTPLYCLSLLLLIVAPNDLFLILVGLLNGCIMLALVTQGAITVEIVPKELLGSWFGMLGFFRGIVNVLSPALGGFLWKYQGPEYVIFFLILTQLIKLPILASMPSSKTRTHKFTLG